METISSSQIQSFLDPRAFAVSRTTARGASDVSQAPAAILTKDVNSTLGLLLGAEQRLADFRTSLQTMLDLSIEGARAGDNEARYDAAYGKLRSLSAGFDQVLDVTRYDGQTLFDGRAWDLQSNGQRVDVDGIDLRAAGENLGLVERADGAKVTIGYDPATLIRNGNSGLVGLDLADAVGIERTDGKPELENGKYRLQIEYNGPNSRLVFSDQFGAKIEELTDVDLTGSGMDIIKFKAGIQISLEKLKATIGYDKYPYETDGPVSVYADLTYERVSWHNLAGDINTADSTASTDWVYQAKRDYSTPALNFRAIDTNGVKEGNLEFAEGDYQLKVKFRGDKSIVEVRDVNGMLRARLDNVDLTGDGDHTIDTGHGMKFTIENRGWDDAERREMNATFSYTPSNQGTRDFDFLAYGQRIVDAIAVIDEQLSTVTSSIDEVKERYSLAQGQSTGSSSATLLLGGGGSVLSLLSGANVSSRIQVSGMQLFSSINSAAGTQSGGTNIFSFLA